MPDDQQARPGPRHAAPRKPLLTRLHVPTGKAVALAAVPSAVLMSMGLMPQLASARPLPDNPFADGPCVTAPDLAEPDADRDDADGEQDADVKDTKDVKDGRDAKDGAKTADGAGGEDTGGRSGAGSRQPSEHTGGAASRKGEPSADPNGAGAPSGTSGGDATTAPGPRTKPSEPGKEAGPEPSPSASASRNPLDPLGIGDALRDLFTPGKQSASPEAPAPRPSGSPDGGKPAEPSPGDDRSARKPDTGGDTSDDRSPDAGEGAEDDAEEKREKDGPAERPSAEESPDADQPPGQESPGEQPPGEEAAGGKEPFPCPEFDARAYRDAAAEPTGALLPDTPWRLESTRLTLLGLKYHGIVRVRTHSGVEKRVLKFTSESLDIRDLHQLVDGPGGTTQHVRARPGSTSTIRGGTVTMYTEQLRGKLFGLIPIVFSPKSPPPLDVPVAFFTDVEVVQAGQFGGTLTVPGMNLSLSD